MALTPITKPAKLRDFSVYDLEWIPHTLEVRVVGTYDGEEYRAFTGSRGVEDFLNFALSQDNRGRWFYAHAGGLYDVQFILNYLIQHKSEEYEIDAKFSGSSAIIVKVRQEKHQWFFLDSFWLLRASLRDIGEKMVGIKKGGLDPNAGASREQIEAYFRDTPIEELIEYNRLDCEILWKAISMFQESLLQLGGQLQMTLASSAMQLFRRRFLKNAVKTREAVNLVARDAYIASRVEVLSRRCDNANYYDINSSFSYAMTEPAPGKLTQMRRSLPPGENQLYLAKARVSVPESFLPPLPYRADGGRIYFPTGEWESHFTNTDLELLEESGGKILSVDEVLLFDPFHDLGAYANTLYEMRRTLDESDPMRTILKLLLNSLGGAPPLSSGGAAPRKTLRKVCRAVREAESTRQPGRGLLRKKHGARHAHAGRVARVGGGGGRPRPRALRGAHHGSCAAEPLQVHGAGEGDLLLRHRRLRLRPRIDLRDQRLARRLEAGEGHSRGHLPRAETVHNAHRAARQGREAEEDHQGQGLFRDHLQAVPTTGAGRGDRDREDGPYSGEPPGRPHGAHRAIVSEAAPRHGPPEAALPFERLVLSVERRRVGRGVEGAGANPSKTSEGSLTSLTCGATEAT